MTETLIRHVPPVLRIGHVVEVRRISPIGAELLCRIADNLHVDGHLAGEIVQGSQAPPDIGSHGLARPLAAFKPVPWVEPDNLHAIANDGILRFFQKPVECWDFLVTVIAALAALAQSTRRDTFRLLVEREPEGVPAAGELARLIAVPQNTVSAHLAILARAGLVMGERQSRSIIYRADLSRFREVALFLLKDCCGGRPDICAPLIVNLTPCCLAKVGSHE